MMLRQVRVQPERENSAAAARTANTSSPPPIEFNTALPPPAGRSWTDIPPTVHTTSMHRAGVVQTRKCPTRSTFGRFALAAMRGGMKA
jgi:hypothetical protein